MGGQGSDRGSRRCGLPGHWRVMCEALGLPVLPLLAFGQQLQARNLKHADRSSWGSKTVTGLYLGEAPSTAGGHLVWILDKEAGKLLLTNTVYPARPTAEVHKKPKYRLLTKTSPNFVKMAVLATALPCHPALPHVARFLPWGEWVQEYEYGDEKEGSDGQAECFKDQSPKEDLHAGRICKAARSYVLTKKDVDEELLRRQSNSWGFPHEELLSALHQKWECSVQLGSSSDGEGVTEETKAFPCLTRFLNKVIGGQNSDFNWNTVP